MPAGNITLTLSIQHNVASLIAQFYVFFYVIMFNEKCWRVEITEKEILETVSCFEKFGVLIEFSTLRF